MLESKDQVIDFRVIQRISLAEIGKPHANGANLPS